MVNLAPLRTHHVQYLVLSRSDLSDMLADVTSPELQRVVDDRRVSLSFYLTRSLLTAIACEVS